MPATLPATPPATLRPLVSALAAALLLLPAGLPAATAAPVTATAVTATGSEAAPASASEPRPRKARLAKIRRALRIALRQQGDRYEYGAAGPHRFDCSGLVYYSTHRAGFRRVPRTSSAQSGFMTRIRRAALRRGDFVFFTSGGAVYHVGIYAGRRDGKRVVLHAPSTGRRVTVEPIWTDGWFAGTLRRR